MTATNLYSNQNSQTSWLKLGYAVIGLALICQIGTTVYRTSLSLRDNQKLVSLQHQNERLASQQAELDRTIAKHQAIKPIQEAMGQEFVPITKFLTASRHLTVASR